MSQENNENTLSFNRKVDKLFSRLLLLDTPEDFFESFYQLKNLLEETYKSDENNYDKIRSIFERMTLLRKDIFQDIDSYRSQKEYKKLKRSEREEIDNVLNTVISTVENFIQVLDTQTELLEREGKHVNDEDYMSPEEIKEELEYAAPMLENEYRHLIEKASIFLQKHKDISSLKLQGLSKKIQDAEEILTQFDKDIDHLTTVQKDVHDELQVNLEDLIKNLQKKRTELVENQLIKQKTNEIKRRQTIKSDSVNLGIDFDTKETSKSSDSTISSFVNLEKMDDTTRYELLLKLHNENAFGIPNTVQKTLNSALFATSNVKEQKEAELTKLLNYLQKIQEKTKIWDALHTGSDRYFSLDLERQKYKNDESDPQMLSLYNRYISYNTARSNAFKALLDHEIESIQLQQNKKIQATAKASISTDEYRNEVLEKVVKSAKDRIFSYDVEQLFLDFNPKEDNVNNQKISREIAEKIGIRSRISKLKRNIYLAQLFGSKKGVDKFKPKLDGYIQLLENEKNYIQHGQLNKEQKEKLSSIFQSQIDYSKQLLGQFDKELTLDRRARRAAKLAGKNMSKKATDLFQSGLEKLQQDSIEAHKKLYEPTPKNAVNNASGKINDEEFINLLKEKMSNLKNTHPGIYRDYLLGLFYTYKTEYQKLNENESDLLKNLPDNTVKLIQELELRGLNIDKQTIESAKFLFEALYEPEDFENLLSEVEGEKVLIPPNYSLGVIVEPVYNVLLWLNTHNLDLSVKNPIDIITDTNTNQSIKTVEMTSFIQSNINLHEDHIKKQLDAYMSIQLQLKKALPLQKVILEKKLYKIEKSVANLLGVRQLNDILRSEILLNVALNDRDQKLDKLADHCTTFAVSLTTGLPSLQFKEPHITKLLCDIIKKEAKRADDYSHLALDKQVSGKHVSAKRAGAALIKQWAKKTVKTKDEDPSPPTAAPAA